MSYIISRPLGGSGGIGHQFHNWIVGRILANRYGLTHVHSPFWGKSIEQQIDIPVEYWELFLKLGNGMITESMLPDTIKRVSIPKIDWNENSYYDVTCDHIVFKNTIERYKGQNVVFECAKDQFIGLGWEFLGWEELADRYFSTRKVPHILSESLLPSWVSNIVIHIRRGDVTKDGRYKVRWVNDEVYLNVIDQLRKFSEKIGRQYLFHIFSDGDKNQLEIFENKDTIVHQEKNVFKIFESMVDADLLMPGQSAFSVFAAHLCKGTILARAWSPFWDNFPETSRFVKVDKDGYIQHDMV